MDLVGLVILLVAAAGAFSVGRQRALPWRGLVYVPFLAPVCWGLGLLGTVLALQNAFHATRAVPPEHRSRALADAIASAMRLTLAGGVLAAVVVLGSWAFFLSRPRRPR